MDTARCRAPKGWTWMGARVVTATVAKACQGGEAGETERAAIRQKLEKLQSVTKKFEGAAEGDGEWQTVLHSKLTERE